MPRSISNFNRHEDADGKDDDAIDMASSVADDSELDANELDPSKFAFRATGRVVTCTGTFSHLDTGFANPSAGDRFMAMVCMPLKCVWACCGAVKATASPKLVLGSMESDAVGGFEADKDEGDAFEDSDDETRRTPSFKKGRLPAQLRNRGGGKSAQNLSEHAAARARCIDELGIDEESTSVFALLQRITGVTELRIKALLQSKIIAEYGPPFPSLHSVVHDLRFDLFFALMVLINAVVTGMDAMYTRQDRPNWIVVMDNVLLSIFVIEICMRIRADTWVWFVNRMNLFDISIILVTGVMVNWVFPVIGYRSSFTELIKSLAALRVLRVSRTCRRIRVFPACKELWLLVRGVMNCVQLLFWAGVVCAVVHYVFAIFVLNTITKSAIFQDDEHVLEFFPSLPRSMFTLFQVMTFSTWATTLRPIIYAMPVSCVLWMAWMGLACLALANMIIAVVVTSSMDANTKDDEANDLKDSAEKARNKRQLYFMFQELDEDKSGELSKEEFTAVLDDVVFVRKMKMMDIDLEELPDIFEILDDGDGQVTVDEFCMGLTRLQGPAMSRDIMKATQRLSRLTHKIEGLEHELGNQVINSVDLIMAAMDSTHDLMHQTLQLIPQVFRKLNSTGIRRIVSVTAHELPLVKAPSLEALLRREGEQKEAEANSKAAAQGKSKNQRHAERAVEMAQSSKGQRVEKVLPGSWVLKRLHGQQEDKLKPEHLQKEADRMVREMLETQDTPGEVAAALGLTWTSLNVSVPKPRSKVSQELISLVTGEAAPKSPAFAAPPLVTRFDCTPAKLVGSPMKTARSTASQSPLLPGQVQSPRSLHASPAKPARQSLI